MGRVLSPGHAADRLVRAGHRRVGGVPSPRRRVAMVAAVAGVLDARPGGRKRRPRSFRWPAWRRATWLTGDRAGRRALRLAGCCPPIIVLGSPWYLSMLHRYPELRAFFFGRELAGRMTGKVDGRHGSMFYYVPVSLVAWLPWWPLARVGDLAGTRAAIRRRARGCAANRRGRLDRARRAGDLFAGRLQVADLLAPARAVGRAGAGAVDRAAAGDDRALPARCPPGSSR